jgi:hypothetical protein
LRLGREVIAIPLAAAEIALEVSGLGTLVGVHAVTLGALNPHAHAKLGLGVDGGDRGHMVFEIQIAPMGAI